MIARFIARLLADDAAAARGEPRYEPDIDGSAIIDFILSVLALAVALVALAIPLFLA